MRMGKEKRNLVPRAVKKRAWDPMTETVVSKRPVDTCRLSISNPAAPDA